MHPRKGLALKDDHLVRPSEFGGGRGARDCGGATNPLQSSSRLQSSSSLMPARLNAPGSDAAEMVSRFDPAPAVELVDVSFAYDVRPVLQGITLTIPRGKIVAIMGGSGCGKSTLLMMVAGLIDSTEGEIAVNGTPAHANCFVVIEPGASVLFMKGPAAQPELDAAEFQVHIHAIGDGAVRASLDAIDVARARCFRRRDELVRDAELLELAVVLGQVLKLGRADEREVGRVEEEHGPLALGVGVGHLDEFAVVVRGRLERLERAVDQGR